MAGIDKIYGTRKQYYEFYDWIKKNRKQYLKFFSRVETSVDETEPLAITNLPEYAEAWLMLHCPIKWVRIRITEQYNIKYRCIEYSNKKKLARLHSQSRSQEVSK